MIQVSTHYVTGLRVYSLHDLMDGIHSLTIRTVHETETEQTPVDICLYFTDRIAAFAYRDAINDANKRIQCERAHAEAMAEHAVTEDEGVA